MKKTLAGLLVLLCTAVLVGRARPTDEPQGSPTKTVVEYLRLDGEGARLSPDRWPQAEGLMTYVAPYFRFTELRVRANYVVTHVSTATGTARVGVDILEWGTLDSSLKFSRWERELSNQPIKEHIEYQLLLTDTHEELNENGTTRITVKGPQQWRINSNGGTAPVIDVDAAIRYVEEIGRNSNDPAVKSNANASLSELKRLQLTNRGDTNALPKESAWQMLVRFSDMEAQGKGLTEDGRRNLSQFFVEPPAKGDGKILVVQDYRVPRWASIYGNKADVTVMMKVLGFLYPSFRYESSAAYGTSTFEEENTYELELWRGSQQAGPDTEGPTSLNVGQLAWKIVDVVRHTDGVEKPSPAFAAEWITVPAACCYLTQALAKTKDPTTRMNVQRSLTVMNHLLTSTQPKQSARTATSSPACAP